MLVHELQRLAPAGLPAWKAAGHRFLYGSDHGWLPLPIMASLVRSQWGTLVAAYDRTWTARHLHVEQQRCAMKHARSST